IVRAPDNWFSGNTLDQRLCGDRIADRLCRPAARLAASKRSGWPRRLRERNHGSGNGSLRGRWCPVRLRSRRRRFGLPPWRRLPAPSRIEQPDQFALDVVRKLALPGLSEMDAVGGTQASNLPIERRATRHEVAGLIDEAVPCVDVETAHLTRALRKDLVEIDDVGRQLRIA